MSLHTPNNEDSVARQFALLQEGFLKGFSGRIQLLRDAFSAWQAAPHERELADTLYRYAHNLAGSSAIFGLPAAGEASRVLMQSLARFVETGAAAASEEMQQVLAAYAKLNQVANDAAAMTARSDSVSYQPGQRVAIHTGKLIYLLDDDVVVTRFIGDRLQSYGYAVEIFNAIAEFERAISARKPEVVLMDMVTPEGGLAGALLVKKISDGYYGRIPVFVLSARQDIESRLAAVRAGASRYFSKPVDMQLLNNALGQVTGAVVEHFRIMIIDDDVFLTELYAEFLAAAGMEVVTLNDPAKALQQISVSPPDLVLLDVNMPGVSGLELGAVLRQFEEYSHIPIVFMTGEQDENKHLASMFLGGDDFVYKSVEPEFLIAILQSRIRKSRALKSGELQVRYAMRELQNYKLALDAHSIVSVTDALGNILEVNAKLVEVSGYSTAELLGRNHRMLKSGIHPETFYREMWQTISSGRVWQGQLKDRKKDGGYFWANATIAPLLNDFGLPERYIAVRTDITLIKNLEQQLQDERTRLELAMDATRAGMWEWNLDSGLVYYSERYRMLLGLGSGANVSWSAQIHEDDFPKVIVQLLDYLAEKTAYYSSEHRKRNDAGGWEWVLESGRAVEHDAHGELVRMVGTIQLINERKELETLQKEMSLQLLKSSRMEAIGHLTGGVAHDFNNILGGMLGYAELAASMLEREAPSLDKIKRYVHEIQSSGARASDLVEQMTLFSKLNPDDEGADVPAIWLKPIFKEVTGLLLASIPATIRLSFRLPENDLKVSMQAVYLHQLLLHLGIYARNAIGEYGDIEFSYGSRVVDGLVCASCAQNIIGKFAEIAVRNSGDGIPVDRIHRIFTPAPGERPGEPVPDLSVVHSIVHALGGHVLLESAAGQGATVRILLPLADMPAAGGEGKAESPLEKQVLSGLHVMVVDDEHTMAAMLSEYLNLSGAEVTTFTQSREALRSFERLPDKFDLVVTDQTMPELTGMDMASQMLKLKPALPVILCTGFSEQQIDENSGIGLVMHKPLKMALLVENIIRLTGQIDRAKHAIS